MLTRPKLGVCTWIFGQRPLPEIVGHISNLGLDGVALLADLERFTAQNLSASAVSRILLDHELELYALTPTNVDLAHPDPIVRQQALNYYQQLLAFAAELGNPLITIHGSIGRFRPVTTLAEEMDLLATAVRQIANKAQAFELRLVFKVLNRYESHLINTGDEAIALLDQVGLDNVGVLLDAYHMNIEEQQAAGAIRRVGDRLWLYHMADSNRQAIGRGHIKFGDQLWALQDIGYDGPIIFECTAPGPNPFTPMKDENSLSWIETYIKESVSWF